MTKVRNFVLVIFCSILCCAFVGVALSGCATSILQIGNEQDKATIEATNETGQSITEITFKSSDADAFGDSLSQSEEWASGEVASIHLTEAQLAIPEIESSDDATDVVFNNLETMRIKTSDGMEYEIHQLNLGDIKDATIRLEGDMAYLEYTSINTGEVVNTLEVEKSYREQKAAEEAAAQKARDDAEKAAKAAEDAKKNASKNTNSGTKPGSSGQGSSTSKPSTGGTSGGSSGSADQEDNCVDDLIFND